MIRFLCLLFISSAYGCTYPSEPLKSSNGQFIQCNSKTSSCPDGHVCSHLWLGMKVCCTDTKLTQQQSEPRQPLINTLDSGNTRQGSLLKKLEKDVNNNSLSSIKVVRPPGQKPQQEKEFQKEQVKNAVSPNEAEIFKEQFLSVPTPIPVPVGNGPPAGYQQVPIPLPVPVHIDVSDIYGAKVPTPPPGPPAPYGQPLTTLPSHAVSFTTATYPPGKGVITDIPSELIGRLSPKTPGPNDNFIITDIPSKIFDKVFGSSRRPESVITDIPKESIEAILGISSYTKPPNKVITDIPSDLINGAFRTTPSHEGVTQPPGRTSTDKNGFVTDIPSELIHNVLSGSSSKSPGVVTDIPSDLFETALGKSSTRGTFAPGVVITDIPPEFITGLDKTKPPSKAIVTDFPSDIIDSVLGKSPGPNGNIVTDIPTDVIEKQFGKSTLKPAPPSGNPSVITDIPSDLARSFIGTTTAAAPTGKSRLTVVTDIPSDLIKQHFGSTASAGGPSFTGTTSGITRPTPPQGYPAPNTGQPPPAQGNNSNPWAGRLPGTQTQFVNPWAVVQQIIPPEVGPIPPPNGYFPPQPSWTGIPTLVPPNQIIPGYPINVPLVTQTPFGGPSYYPSNEIGPSGGYGNEQKPIPGYSGQENSVGSLAVIRPNNTAASFRKQLVKDLTKSVTNDTQNSNDKKQNNSKKTSSETNSAEQKVGRTPPSSVPDDLTDLPKELLSFVFSHMVNKPTTTLSSQNGSTEASFALPIIICNTTDPPIVLPLGPDDDRDKNILANLHRAGCRFNAAAVPVVLPLDPTSAYRKAVIRPTEAESNGEVKQINVTEDNVTKTKSTTSSDAQTNTHAFSGHSRTNVQNTTQPVRTNVTENITAVPNAVMLQTTNFPMASPSFSGAEDGLTPSFNTSGTLLQKTDRGTTKLGIVKAITPAFLLPNLQSKEELLLHHLDADKVTVQKVVGGPRTTQPIPTSVYVTEKNPSVTIGNYTGIFGRQLVVRQTTPKYRRFGFRNVHSEIDNAPLELVAVVDSQDEK